MARAVAEGDAGGTIHRDRLAAAEGDRRRAVRVGLVESIGPGMISDRDLVQTATTDDGVVTELTTNDEGVVARAAEQGVVAGPARERVVSAEGVQLVVPLIDRQHVVAGTAVERIHRGRAVPAVEEVPTRASVQLAVTTAIERVEPVTALERVEPTRAMENVVPVRHGEQIVSSPAVEGVAGARAHAADQGVAGDARLEVILRAVERRMLAAAGQGVKAHPAGERIGRGQSKGVHASARRSWGRELKAAGVVERCRVLVGRGPNHLTVERHVADIEVPIGIGSAVGIIEEAHLDLMRDARIEGAVDRIGLVLARIVAR